MASTRTRTVLPPPVVVTEAGAAYTQPIPPADRVGKVMHLQVEPAQSVATVEGTVSSIPLFLDQDVDV
jgi:hypothetical protein